jgi:hypothetical protein
MLTLDPSKAEAVKPCRTGPIITAASRYPISPAVRRAIRWSKCSSSRSSTRALARRASLTCRLRRFSAREPGARCILAAYFSPLAKRPLRISSLCWVCWPVRAQVLKKKMACTVRDQGKTRSSLAGGCQLRTGWVLFMGARGRFAFGRSRPGPGVRKGCLPSLHGWQL